MSPTCPRVHPGPVLAATKQLVNSRMPHTLCPFPIKLSTKNLLKVHLERYKRAGHLNPTRIFQLFACKMKYLILLALASSTIAQDVISNYVRVRGEADDENNGYVITEEVENLGANCVFQSRRIIEVCAHGKWAVYTKEKFSLNSTVLFVPNTCIDEKNPYNIDLEKYADVQSARPIGHSDPSVVQLSVYQGKFFKGKSKDFVTSKKIRFTANSAVITGGRKWVLYKKENETSSAICLNPTGNSYVILEHEELKDFRFVEVEVLPIEVDECPAGSKSIVIAGGIAARSELGGIPFVAEGGAHEFEVHDSIMLDSLNK